MLIKSNERVYFDADLTEWGLGFNVGKADYAPYQYYFELYFLCFQFIFWFWKKYE
jgi:hypothetical protein